MAGPAYPACQVSRDSVASADYTACLALRAPLAPQVRTCLETQAFLALLGTEVTLGSPTPSPAPQEYLDRRGHKELQGIEAQPGDPECKVSPVSAHRPTSLGCQGMLARLGFLA